VHPTAKAADRIDRPPALIRIKEKFPDAAHICGTIADPAQRAALEVLVANVPGVKTVVIACAGTATSRRRDRLPRTDLAPVYAVKAASPMASSTE
jgi:hypothetical protein